MPALAFHLNGEPVHVDGLSPTTTLLEWLRLTGRTGTKEGCAEGDCGACTVVFVDEDAPGGPRYRAVNSCLVLVPMVHGRSLLTVEGLATGDALHPAQQALVDRLGSQCGYCTPGIVMSLFEATYRADLDAAWKLDDQMCGNLCRCTGYRPIRDALNDVAGTRPPDAFADALRNAEPGDRRVRYAAAGQEWRTPTSLAALWSDLDDLPGAQLIVGGTDLSLAVTKAHQRLPAVISLEAVPGLREIRREGDGWRFGATVRLSDLEDHTRDSAPAVHRMLRFFASRQIKNRGTLGGNLCNASPIGDLAPALTALDATARILGRGGERDVPLESFFLSYRQTALQPGEILASVFVPDQPPDARIGTYKVSKRRELDISAVAAGLRVRVTAGLVTEARLCFGGMAATTARASRTEAALVGRPWTVDAVDAVLDFLEEDFAPMTDHRGTAWYRMTLARNLLRGFAMETADRGFAQIPDRPTATVVLEAP